MASSLSALLSTIPRCNLLFRPSTLRTLTSLKMTRHDFKKRQLQVRFNSLSTSFTAAQSDQDQALNFREGSDLVVLGIETSCDDTAAAVVSCFLSFK